jgi:hypothetical protein
MRTHEKFNDVERVWSARGALGTALPYLLGVFVIFFLLCGSGGFAAEGTSERRLNNLVVEVANVSGAAAGSLRTFKFEQPIDGWVYLSARGQAKGAGQVALSFDSETDERLGIGLDEKNPRAERQSYLSAGEHVLKVEKVGDAQLESVVLRRVPEMAFSKFGATPRTLSAGDYDWDFYAKYLLPHVNTIVGMDTGDQLSYIRQWKSRGGRWLVETPRAENPADILKRFSMRSPHVDGALIDEFDPQTPDVVNWLKKLGNEKEARLYFADIYGKGGAFVKTALAAGRKIVWEKYVPEYPTGPNDQTQLYAELTLWMRDLRRDFPGIATNLYLCLGFLSTPPLTVNRSPEIDFKVWMDRQFQIIATEPAFAGLPGIMEYQTRYADEETVRWAGLLFRHYGIEGRTNLLSFDYNLKLRLTHISNPDFLEGTNGWTFAPANANVKGEVVPKLSWYEGRFPFTNYWDKALAVTAADGPVEVKQTIRDLTAGRLYSAKLMSVRKQDIQNAKSEAMFHPVELVIAGATTLRGVGSRDLITCPPSGARAPFTGENPLWVDYRQVVFHAEAATAELKIVVAKNPATYLLNFVEVQPYLAR